MPAESEFVDRFSPDHRLIVAGLARIIAPRVQSGPGLGWRGENSGSGAWRSLVAHLLWEQRVGGSNPSAPTTGIFG